MLNHEWNNKAHAIWLTYANLLLTLHTLGAVTDGKYSDIREPMRQRCLMRWGTYAYGVGAR